MVIAKSCHACMLALIAGVFIADSALAGALTVTRTGSGTGTVTSSPGAINCAPTCNDTIADGTPIVLTAAPAGGNQFTGWLGPCTGTGTCSFTVNGNTTAVATFAPLALGQPALDIDGNFTYDALTDGLLILRYMFGRTGTALTSGAVGAGAPRNTATLIGNYLADIKPTLDIDGNGQVDALTDGMLILRYLFGLRGASLVAGAVGTDPLRDTPAEIEPQMQGLMPAFPSFTLTVAKNGSGDGTVTSAPPGIACGADCNESYEGGTVVTLTAVASPGSTFTGWGNSCTSVTPNIVTMNAARNVTATFTLNPPAGSGWIPANRICPTAEGDDSLGAFALPNGQLAAASAKGISVQGAGLPFPPPAAFTQAAYVNAGWFHVRAVIRPDSSGIIAWPTIGTVSVQDRAADGTYTGTRQVISGSGNFMLGMDGANNATLAYWKQVTGNELHVITRAAGATSFADPIGQTVATAVALDLRGLVVDPDGAAVVVWQEAGALKQAVRAAGAGSFGAPATIQAANVGGTTQYAGPTVGANAAGRAVLAFYDIVTLQYRAAIREPGGAFGAPVDLGAGRIFGVARTAVAVAQDGNAAVLADSYGPETACPMGTYWPSAAFGSILRFSVASGSTSWTTDGAIGGGSGSNAVWGTLAGGAGSRIEASWWQDPATLQVLCDGSERTLQLVAGTLGGSMTTVYNDSLLPKGQPSTYNRIPVPSSVMDSMALNACGDGVLVFSINPVNNFGELPATAINDGIYVASTKGCP